MIPDFLKKKPNLSETDKKLKDVLARYKEHFQDDDLTTEGFEPSYLVELLEECLEKDVKLSKLLGEKHDPTEDW